MRKTMAKILHEPRWTSLGALRLGQPLNLQLLYSDLVRLGQLFLVLVSWGAEVYNGLYPRLRSLFRNLLRL